MDSDSFKIYIKTEEIYVDIAKDIEKTIYTSNYESGRALPSKKN